MRWLLLCGTNGHMAVMWQSCPKCSWPATTLHPRRNFTPGRKYAEPARKHKMCSKQALKWCGKISETHRAPCSASKHMMGAASANLALARANELVRCCGGQNHPFGACVCMLVCISAGVMLCGGGGGFLDVARTSASVPMSSR